MKQLLLFILTQLTMAKELNLQSEWKQAEANGMVFQWKMEDQNLRCRMAAPTTGWVAVGFNTSPELTGTNLIMGAVLHGFCAVDDQYILVPGVHKSILELGGHNQISMRKGVEEDGFTTIEFVIGMHPKDKFHKELVPGREYHVLLAYSEEDDFEHHSRMRTSIKINL